MRNATKLGYSGEAKNEIKLQFISLPPLYNIDWPTYCMSCIEINQ